MKLSPLIPVLSDSVLKTLCKQCSFTKKITLFQDFLGLGDLIKMHSWVLAPPVFVTLRLPADINLEITFRCF